MRPTDSGPSQSPRDGGFGPGGGQEATLALAFLYDRIGPGAEGRVPDGRVSDGETSKADAGLRANFGEI
jgi:hypothetical protein